LQNEKVAFILQKVAKSCIYEKI